MLMKKLFYLLLALPLMFVACNEQPDVTPEVKSYELAITSEATLNFDENGGEGVITYTLTEKEATRSAQPAPEPKVEAKCEAAWVTDLKVEENITFTVAANEGEARETKVVVSYDKQSFEVKIAQAAKSVTPEPKPEYVLDMEFAAAARIPSAELDIAPNTFALMFADDSESNILEIFITGAEEDLILKAGEYEIEDSLLTMYEEETELEFDGGVAVVEVAEEVYSFDIVLENSEGAYHFTYEGIVYDMEPEETPVVEPKDFTPVKVEAYRQASWDLGNFELDLYIDEENYHSLDMQDNVNPNDAYLTAGVYSMDDKSITDWSNFLWNVETGEGAYFADAEITLTHNEDGTSTIVGYIESEYGDHLDIEWTGVIEGFDFGTAPELPETPEVEGINVTAVELIGTYYAPSAEVPTHNYYFVLTDVVTNGNTIYPAKYFGFDLYSNEVNDSYTIPNGVYTFDLDETCAAGTAGAYYTYGYMLDEVGDLEWVLYNSGTITVTDGKIEANLVRDNGDNVTVTFEGNLQLELEEVSNSHHIEGNGWAYSVEYFGDYYGVGADNWGITIVEDPTTGEGGMLALDILVDPAQDDWFGTFTSADQATTSFYNTYIPGAINEVSLGGSFYAVVEGGYAVDYAMIETGSIVIANNEDGSKTFTFDCYDTSGYSFTGSVTASNYSTPAPAMAAKGEKTKKLVAKRPMKKSLIAR